MRLAVAVVAASLLGGAASAQMVEASVPDSVASAIQDAGFRASVFEFDAVVGSFGNFVFANESIDADEPTGETISL